MPGYVIHIAIAKEYSKRNNMKCSDDLIQGTISPDLTDDKSKTHYGKSPAYTNLYEFLKVNEINNDYNLGRFIHLIADYLFYNKYLTVIKKPDLYEDYDRTNKYLIDKYKIQIPENISDKVFFMDGELSILSIELIENLIDEIASLDLNITIDEIKNKDIKWNNYKRLV